MSREAVEQIVGRAIVDRAFCAQLLAAPAEAASGYDLSEFERRLLGQIRARDLAEFAHQLELKLELGTLGRRADHAHHLLTRRARRASA